MKRPPEPSNDDPRGFHARVREHLDWLTVLKYSVYSIDTRRRYFKYFIAWCELRGITRPSDITLPILERYQRHMATHISEKTGKPVGVSQQVGTLCSIQVFYRWLARRRLVLYNPAADLEIPRRPKRLPKAILTEEEVDRVLSKPNVKDALGLRDRAMLELFYTNGIRRGELCQIKLHDLNLKDGFLQIREGKGDKDRMVPVGKRACHWIERYLTESRPHLVSGHDERWVFLTNKGEFFVRNAVTFLIRKYIDAAGIGKPGSCHLFRHACATHMLENGADTRYIQEMLGHENLKSTEIYTHVVITKLKEIHDRTHPARLDPNGDHD